MEQQLIYLKKTGNKLRYYAKFSKKGNNHAYLIIKMYTVKFLYKIKTNTQQ